MQRGSTVIIVLLVWLVPLVATGMTLWLTPNVVTRSANAGRFLSAEARPGGFMTPGIQTVQTTRGTLMVRDIFTALRGEPLKIVVSTKDGIEVCGTQPHAACADLVGRYVGTLPPVPHRSIWLAYTRRQELKTACLGWGVLGLAAFALAMTAWLEGEDGGDGKDGQATPDGASP